MLLIQKSPLSARGSKSIHRRTTFGQETVYEQRYFTRYGRNYTKPFLKPEVL